MLLSLRKGGSKTSYTTSTTTTTTSRVDIETSIESILPRKTPFKLPKRTFPNQSILHKMTLIFLCCVGILILGLSTTRTVRALSSGSDDTAKNLISLVELSALVDDIRGDDLRLVRWDATKHTRRRQKEKSDNDNDLEPCPVALPKALQVIGYYGQQQVDTDTVWTDEQALQVALACEYATFCITDSPTNRALLSTYQIDPASPVENDNPVPPKTFTIHKAIVRVVQQTLYPKASAKAAHLIYIASFNNKINHRAFFRANAVAVLSQIIKSYSVVDSKTPSHKNDSTVSTTSSVTSEQAMWAAAALQNLAASYCSTENDGRCYWTWMSAMSSHAIIEEDSLPVLSDGTTVRRTALTDSDLLPALGAMVCQLGPVKGAMSTTNPYPGDNAVINQHEESPNVVAWAAAGALKNLALEAEAVPHIAPYLTCLCRMAKSKDWLEENKGQGAIHHLRPADPCWFKDDTNGLKDGDLCVDDEFVDEEGYVCADYGEATKQECLAMDVKREVSANQACCGCGGGQREGRISEPEL